MVSSVDCIKFFFCKSSLDNGTTNLPSVWNSNDLFMTFFRHSSTTGFKLGKQYLANQIAKQSLILNYLEVTITLK